MMTDQTTELECKVHQHNKWLGSYSLVAAGLWNQEFYLYWSNFAYFIHSCGLLSYDSIISWTSSTLMLSLSKMLCRIFIRSSKVSGFTSSVCSISLIYAGSYFSDISFQSTQQVALSNFAQSFTFYRLAPQFGGELAKDCTIMEKGERPQHTG